MSSAKSGALTLLVIGSIFLFIISCWQILLVLLFGYGYLNLITYGLEFLASLLLMIGFIMFRGEQSKHA